MARVVVSLEGLDRDMRPELTLRARRALAIYSRAPLRRDRPGYPFAQHPEDGSIRRKRSQSIRPIPGGVRIKVQSRGAPFIEEGNQAGGRYIYPSPGTRDLALPLRQRQGPGITGKARTPGGRVTVVNGRPYLMVQRVRTYRGRHLLERSVRLAFTGRSGRL